MAVIQRKRQTSGAGLLLEIIGFCMFIFGVINILTVIFSIFGIFWVIAGIVLVYVGFRMSFRLVCSNCGNRVDSKDVKLCPVCKEALSDQSIPPGNTNPAKTQVTDKKRLNASIPLIAIFMIVAIFVFGLILDRFLS